MDYQTEVTEDNVQIRGRARGKSEERRHNGSGLSGVKRQAVSETSQKSQQGTGNSRYARNGPNECTNRKRPSRH